MLVLGCKIGETIHIGNYMSVTLVRNGRENVRLGFTAPDDIRIKRDKIFGRREKTTGTIPPASLPTEYRNK